MKVFGTMFVATAVSIGLMVASTQLRIAEAANNNDQPTTDPMLWASDIDYNLVLKGVKFAESEADLEDLLLAEKEPVFLSSQLPPFVFKQYNHELDCLTNNLYFEARGESLQGKLAVGLVTLNRVISKRYPNTICKVVFQKRKHPTTGKIVGQFSWTVDENSNVPNFDSADYDDVRQIAVTLLDRDNAIHDFTNGSTHYHATYVAPAWSKKLIKIAKFDEHIFYIE